jgi:CubicO group peptidase (beta-lactamase class C family)
MIRALLVRILLAIPILIIISIAALFAIYPAPYVQKTITHLDSSVSDMYYFPSSNINHAETIYYFSTNYQDEAVELLFEQQLDIQDFKEYLERTDTSSFIVIQDDDVIYEKYLSGYERDSLVTSFSVAKSFASTLIGIAIDERLIESIEDPITEYIPELTMRDSDFQKITIEHLLMMSSGISYKETNFINGDDAKTYFWPDLQDLAVNMTKIDGAPMQKFHYNNYHPLLIGVILERVTGMTVSQYMEEKLWTQIGTEFEAGWSLDDTGFEKMESGINARAIDFAKFGRLFLNNGAWEGKQIVSQEWVSRATSPPIILDYEDYYSEYSDYIFEDGQGFYKYFWWGLKRNVGYDYFALGNHGQFIYVSPEKKLIIVRFGESYGSSDKSYPWIKAFYDFTSEF